ncbi:hypothetical protein [Pyrococcus sp. ST04]|uniref:hypothetical protein n=1 Tax=Pyrococcus sp. ST04 TaxID=1183377 RepID=UPI00026059B4|nr:hypothetical protein [Pyrococcus sp. ST04]AFK21861.1 putative OB-fold nucleic acid binding domain-containing protein [Pyrococcus sp. ST04]
MQIRDVIYLLLSIVFLGLALIVSNQEPTKLSDASEGSLVEFVGVCAYSSGDFSILTDGQVSVPVYSYLEPGKVYRVVGIYRGKGIKPREIREGTLELEEYIGAYWVDYYPSILTPKKIKLRFGLQNVTPGDIVKVRGVFFGSRLVPVEYEKLGRLREPRDGFPFNFTGVVLYGGNPALMLWENRSVRVYLRDNKTLTPGHRVSVLGITRVSGSRITVYASNFSILGIADEMIVSGGCRISEVLDDRVKVECLDMPLSNVTGRVGDIVEFKALKRFRDYLCLSCNVTQRATMENMICHPEIGKVGRVSGVVEEASMKRGSLLIKVSKNGCKVLVKIREQLNVKPGDKLDAFGVFSTYYSNPVLIVQGREDICVNSSCN